MTNTSKQQKVGCRDGIEGGGNYHVSNAMSRKQCFVKVCNELFVPALQISSGTIDLS